MCIRDRIVVADARERDQRAPGEVWRQLVSRQRAGMAVADHPLLAADTDELACLRRRRGYDELLEHPPTIASSVHSASDCRGEDASASTTPFTSAPRGLCSG